MVKKNRMSTAKGICLRNGLEGYETIEYRETADDGKAPEDVFGPLTKKESCLRLNPEVEVVFVSKNKDIE